MSRFHIIAVLLAVAVFLLLPIFGESDKPKSKRADTQVATYENSPSTSLHKNIIKAQNLANRNSNGAQQAANPNKPKSQLRRTVGE